MYKGLTTKETLSIVSESATSDYNTQLMISELLTELTCRTNNKPCIQRDHDSTSQVAAD
jgi:hypothetical protein